MALTLSSAAGPVNILHDVSLSVPPGQTVALTGPSGSGKSSLLMVAAGLERPSGGRVIVAGTDITQYGRGFGGAFPPGPPGHRLSVLSSDPDHDGAGECRGAAGIERGRRRLGTGTGGIERVGLGDRAEHYPGQLSGGEQQRVALARAMAPRPQILFADEPTGNLDSANGEAIADLLFALNAERGATLFLVTHEENLARRCKRDGAAGKRQDRGG